MVRMEEFSECLKSKVDSSWEQLDMGVKEGRELRKKKFFLTTQHPGSQTRNHILTTWLPGKSLRKCKLVLNLCEPGDFKLSARDSGDNGLIPRSGRSPGGGNGNPLQYSCWENPMAGYSPWGHKESDMTEHTHTSGTWEMWELVHRKGWVPKNW